MSFDTIRADGWREGLPVVETRAHTVEHVGEPVVDFDGLEQLYGRELSLPAELHPKATIMGNGDSRSYNIPLGLYRGPEEGLLINAVRILCMPADLTSVGQLTPGEEIARVVAHESQHHKDTVLHPNRTTFEHYAHAGASYAAGIAVSQVATRLGMPKRWRSVTTPAVGLAAKVLTEKQYYWRINPREKRARAFSERRELLDEYADIIRFPEMDSQTIE